MRRNRPVFAAIATVFVVLVGGVIVSTSLYLRAERREASRPGEARSGAGDQGHPPRDRRLLAPLGRALVHPRERARRSRRRLLDHRGDPLDRRGRAPGAPRDDPEGDQVLTRYVHRALGDRFRDKVIPLLDCFKVYDQISGVNTNDTPRMLAVKMGEILGTNLVMAGNVWRYKERVGGSYGVDSPASVAFAVHLIHVASGKPLWSAKFEETQKSLSENLLSAKAFFERKGKWLTVNELAQYGVNEIFKKFPLR